MTQCGDTPEAVRMLIYLWVVAVALTGTHVKDPPACLNAAVPHLHLRHLCPADLMHSRGT